MPKVNVYDMAGEQIEELELNKDIFGIEPNEHVVYEAVKCYHANQRQGTQDVKTRAEVRGGGRKPWNQKGSGRARHGSRRSPIWAGGGVTFAPKPRDYGYKLPKKTRQLAIKSVLSSKVENKDMIIMNDLTIDSPKTKEIEKVLNKLELGKKVLIVTKGRNENLVRATNNLPNVKTIVVNNLNVYDILNSDSFVITKDAIEKVQEVYA